MVAQLLPACTSQSTCVPWPPPPPTAAAAAPQPATLAPGVLINYKKADQHILALVVEPDGKRNWRVLDQRGHRFSLQPRSVSLVLPGSGFGPDDLARFEAAASTADMELLELAWACAAEEPQPYSLPSLARLLWDDDAALQQYVTFCLLLHDAVYFTPSFRAGAWSFVPRTPDQVELAVAAAEEASAEASAAAEFAAEMADARARAAKTRPADVAAQQHAWRSGPHGARITALLDYGLSGPGRCPPGSEALARDTLRLLSRRPEPDAAVAALTEAGLLRLHEPVPLLRTGRGPQGFEPDGRQLADALRSSPPPDVDAARRLDLRHLPVFAVDDASTRDVDDGVSVSTDDSGRTLIWVHVADPTRWFRPGVSCHATPHPHPPICCLCGRQGSAMHTCTAPGG